MIQGSRASRRALLLLNPNAGNAKAGLDVGLQCLRSADMDVIVKRPEGPDGLRRAISEHRDQLDCIIVGGGDGSMNFALPFVMQAGLPMGILPMGTANDLARTLDIPLNVESACQIIADGHLSDIDVGQVNDRHFFNVAHIGLAVEVARRADKQAKGCLGPLAYPYMAWQAFRTRRTFKVRIDCEGELHSLRVVQVSVGNGRFYGGGVPIAEDATIDDGQLDLYALPARKGSSLLALIPAVGRGRTRGTRDIFTLRGREVIVITNRSKGVTVDGEEVERTPARFRVLPGALKVYTAAREADGVDS
ncbi:MAG: lipid kinase [Salinisphaeraceae bacterium]|nr:lipid kinase [Salinisphaeraceae bacterium]